MEGSGPLIECCEFCFLYIRFNRLVKGVSVERTLPAGPAWPSPDACSSRAPDPEEKLNYHGGMEGEGGGKKGCKIEK